MTAEPVLDAIVALLREHGLEHRIVHHGPTRTSSEAAEARGEELRVGGKALLLRIDGRFALFVLSAARKLDSSAIKQAFQVKKLRFATPAELEALAGLEPGAVPPFGHPILPFPLYVDADLQGNDRIAFNAGSLTTSIIMGLEDYLSVARPTILRFTQPGDEPT